MMTEKATIQEDIEKATQILLEAGAREVFIFGSASCGKERPDSDIDLAVRGLPQERLYETVGRVLVSISRSLDLVDLDEDNLFTEYLVKKGGLKRVA